MSEECDHSTTMTPFCPLCGKQIGSPLETLRKHCANQAMAARVAGKRYVSMSIDESDLRLVARRERHVKARKRTQAKWDRWVNALDAAIRIEQESA